MDDLERLVARDRIREAAIGLFDATDARDWPRVRECFADRVRFDMTSLVGGAVQTLPAAQIVATWQEGLAPLQAVHHQLGNLLVSLDDGEADAASGPTGAVVTCHGIATHYLPNPAGSVRAFVGTYALHLIPVGAGWRIDAFRFDCKYVAGNIRLEETGEDGGPAAR